MTAMKIFTRNERVWPIFMVSFVGLICYLNTLKAGFAYDDNRAVLENSDIHTSTPWIDVWYNDFWGTPLSHSGSHKSYRPLTVLSFKLNYMIGELNPLGYHLVNVLLHAVNCGLFSLLALYFFGNISQCLVAGLLFAVHPIHTEAVAGIVGRADVASGLFYMLSLLAYIRAANPPTVCSYVERLPTTDWKYFMFSIACSVAAMLTKEMGITVLGVCLVYDVMLILRLRLDRFSMIFTNAKSRGTITRITLLLLSGSFILFWRCYIMHLSTPTFTVSDNPAASHSDVKVRLLTFLYLPVANIWLLLFPWQLSFDWSMDAVPLILSISDIRNLASLLLYSSLGFLSFKYIRGIVFEKLRYNTDNESYTDSDSSSASKKNGFKTKQKAFNKLNIDVNSDNYFTDGVFKFNCMLRYSPNGHLDTLRNGGKLQNGVSKQNGVSMQNGVRKQNGLDKQNGLNKQNDVDKQKSTAQSKENRNGNPNYGVESGLPNNNHGRNSSSDDSAPSESLAIRNKKLRRRPNVYPRKKQDWRKLSAIESFDEDVHTESRFGFSCFLSTDENLHEDFDPVIFYLAMLVISFLPATNLLFYVGFVIAERILYIPSMAYSLLIASGLGTLWNGQPRHRILFKYGFIVLIALLAARTVVRNEDWKDEETLYRSGVNINPAKAWGNLGSIMSQEGRIAEAETAYRKAIDARPNMADTHYNLGILLQKMKRYDEAAEAYRNAIEYRPSLASAYLNLGLLYDETGHQQEALQILESARNLSEHGLRNPKAHHHSLTSIRYNIGKILFDLGRYQESAATFHDTIDKMPSSYSPHSIYNMLGQAYSFLGNRNEAEAWYQKSLQANSTHVPAHLTFARHLAAMALTLSISIIRGTFNQSLPIWARLLGVSFHQGNHERAEEWFTKALKLQPSNSDSHFHYSEFLLARNRQQEALAEMEIAVDLNPNEVDLVVFTASHFREAKKYEKAEALYKKAIQLRPNAPGHHMNLGALYHLTGRLDEAEVSYLEALRLNPGDDLTHSNLRKLRSIKSRTTSQG